MLTDTDRLDLFMRDMRDQAIEVIEFAPRIWVGIAMPTEEQEALWVSNHATSSTTPRDNTA
jgi:uncharacterized NAD(P)/FAD-binding protein YdhS